MISPRDIEIFHLLNPERRFTYLPSNWIAHFLGTQSKTQANYVSARLGELSREPNGYLVRPTMQRESLNSSYKHQVFKLSEKGMKWMIENEYLDKRPTPRRDPYKHRLGADICLASLEIGAGEDFVSFWDLMEEGKTPLNTNPLKIPVGETYVEPDGFPFAVRKGGKVRYVLALEFDRDTTDKTGGGHDTIQNKLRKYKELFEQRAYRTYFNFDNAIVLCVSTSRRGLERMKKVVHGYPYSVFEKPPTWLWFQQTEDWSTAPHFPKPSGFLYENEWSRVGHPNIKIGEFIVRN